MKLLLDTHAFIWWDIRDPQLSATAQAAIREPANEVLLSVVSIWEMQIKSQLGKLPLRLPLSDIISQQQANGLQVLHATLQHVLAVDTLPAAHKDPFDRLLIAQAIEEGATLVTADTIFRQYPMPTLW
jgi:PIN domain nuclease of toxin-antitoxin system